MYNVFTILMTFKTYWLTSPNIHALQWKTPGYIFIIYYCNGTATYNITLTGHGTTVNVQQHYAGSVIASNHCFTFRVDQTITSLGIYIVLKDK